MVTRRNRKYGGSWFKSTPKKAYPGSGYNNNYEPSFPPSNSQEVSTYNPTRGYPGSGYNNNYTPSFPPSNGEYWRTSKREVSKYKSLFNKIASGQTKRNVFGRGPNSQIASKIRNNNIHRASKIRRRTRRHY
jgi:hypothetical protein